MGLVVSLLLYWHVVVCVVVACYKAVFLFLFFYFIFTTIVSGVHCNVRCLSPETSHKANNCPQSVINQLLTLSLFQCHDVTWKWTIKVLNLKFLDPFLFSFALVCQRISIRMHNIEGRFRCRTEFFSVCRCMCALFCLEILQAVAAMGLSHMQLCVCVSIIF